MINLEEIMQKIEDDWDVEKTTKELKAEGLNDYYIKKALENGSLEKIIRGKYKVVAIDKRRKRNRTFRDFAYAVFKNDFETAYENLLINLENQTTNEYVYHLKLYFLLLKELLPNEKDFSFIDDIPAFCDSTKNESYFRHFTEFTEAVLSADFNKAYPAIYNFKKAEEETRGDNTLSTKLFLHLAFNINKQKLAENIASEKKVPQIKDEKNNTILFKENYEKLRESIENNNYEDALHYLETTIKYATPNTIGSLKKMQGVIRKYLDIKASKEILEEQEIDYSEYQDNYIKIFNKALTLKDYQTAYKNIGKCVHLNKASTKLQLFSDLLHTLISQNNLNKKNKKVPKTENVIVTQSRIVNPIEEKPNVEIDINTLMDLIYNRKYPEVKALLSSQTNSDNKTYQDILNMIRYMDNLKNTNFIKEEKLHFYKNDPTSYVKRFFEALNYRCYEEALSLVDDCIDISSRYNCSEKFIIYKYLLEDIVTLKEEILENQARLEKLKNIKYNQKSIIYKRQISQEDIVNLEKVTLEKFALATENETIYDGHILEMIETLRNIQAYNLDENSFETFTYTETDIIEKFMKAISLGDYQAAYEISKDEKWNKEINKSENRDYLLIYKKLLFQINKGIKNNSLPFEYKDIQEPLEEKALLKQLATLKELVKKRKFTTAYNYYQEQNLEGVSEELDLILQTFLPFIKITVEKESQEIEKDYKKAKNRGDYEGASKLLDEYQEFIKFNDLDRNLDYHRARIISEKAEQATPDFAEKKKLYSTAIGHIQKHQYEEAIKALNEYLKKDNDISAKGYLLRGRCYEYLNKYQEAKNDYEKAISIIPEPNAYYRLGKVNCYIGEFEKAIEYFLEYEARRPELHEKNLIALRDIYKILGQEELSKKYEKIIKRNAKN